MSNMIDHIITESAMDTPVTGNMGASAFGWLGHMNLTEGKPSISKRRGNSQGSHLQING
jgi:hypothetical protein